MAAVTGPVWFRPQGSPTLTGHHTRKDMWYFLGGACIYFVYSDHNDWHISREFQTRGDVERNQGTVLVHCVGDRTLLDPDLLVDINL